jgi:Holliday junction DNA helicase RuvA
MHDRVVGEPIELDIYYHVTDRQMRPTLIGFNNGFEKRFFEKFISVEDIGPQRATRALTLSVSTIARAIESEDLGVLRGLPGVGDRTARKMVATLKGKVTEEALLRDEGFATVPPTDGAEEKPDELLADGVEILVSLGHRRPEATAKIEAALKRNANLATVQELIGEVYRGER